MMAKDQMFPYVLTSEDDAKRVLEAMLEIIKKYTVVSLSDLYDLVGLPISRDDSRSGWTNLDGAHIHKIPDGYVLLLPLMEAI